MENNQVNVNLLFTRHLRINIREFQWVFMLNHFTKVFPGKFKEAFFQFHFLSLEITVSFPIKRYDK